MFVGAMGPWVPSFAYAALSVQICMSIFSGIVNLGRPVYTYIFSVLPHCWIDFFAMSFGVCTSRHEGGLKEFSKGTPKFGIGRLHMSFG